MTAEYGRSASRDYYTNPLGGPADYGPDSSSSSRYGTRRPSVQYAGLASELRTPRRDSARSDTSRMDDIYAGMSSYGRSLRYGRDGPELPPLSREQEISGSRYGPGSRDYSSYRPDEPTESTIRRSGAVRRSASRREPSSRDFVDYDRPRFTDPFAADRRRPSYKPYDDREYITPVRRDSRSSRRPRFSID